MAECTNCVSLQQQLTTSQAQVNNLGGEKATLEARVSNLEGEKATLEARVSNLEGEKTALEARVGNLEGEKTTLEARVSNLEGEKATVEARVGNLEGEKTTLEGRVSNLEEEKTDLERKVNNLQHQFDESQVQLLSARSETALHQEKRNEISEKYQDLYNASGIKILRDLLTNLSHSQIDDLNKHTSFRENMVEIAHTAKQIECSSLFVQSTLAELKLSVESVIHLQTNILAAREQGKDGAIKSLRSGGTPKAVIDAALEHVQTEIVKIETDIEGWNKFSDLLMNAVNQSNLAKTEDETTTAPVDEVEIQNSQ